MPQTPTIHTDLSPTFFSTLGIIMPPPIGKEAISVAFVRPSVRREHSK